MKKRNFFVAVLAVLMVMNAAATYAGTWRVGHTRPIQTPLQQDLEKFAEAVNEGTEGRVKIQVCGAGQLGNAEVVMEQVSIGAIEMTCGWPNTTLDKRLEVYNLPGAVKDFKEASVLYSLDSPFMQIMDGIYKDHDLKLLASYPCYYEGVSFRVLSDKDLLNPNDKHNLKIRVPAMNVYRLTAESVGYLTTPLPWGEVFTAMQTGIVDGAFGAGAETNYLMLRDVIKAYMPMFTNVGTWHLLMNMEVWNDLSEADKEVVQKAATKFESDRFAVVETEEEGWWKKLEEAGVQVFVPSPEQRAAFQEKIVSYVWPELRESIGPKYFDKAVAAINESLGQ